MAEEDWRSRIAENWKHMAEYDPTGKAPGEPGAKLDAGKPAVYQGLLDYFPRALQAVAEISTFGATKYTWKGWETVEDGVNRYENALARHILKEAIEGPEDPDSHLLHKAHRAWNDLASLELYLRKAESGPSTAAGTEVAQPSLSPNGAILMHSEEDYKDVVQQYFQLLSETQDRVNDLCDNILATDAHPMVVSEIHELTDYLKEQAYNFEVFISGP